MIVIRKIKVTMESCGPETGERPVATMLRHYSDNGAEMPILFLIGLMREDLPNEKWPPVSVDTLYRWYKIGEDCRGRKLFPGQKRTADGKLLTPFPADSVEVKAANAEIAKILYNTGDHGEDY